jgi:Serpentine type 7TM GPCR chemoreceptor Srbc
MENIGNTTECGLWIDYAAKVVDIFAVVVNLFGLLANAFLLFVMFKTRKIRKNSANSLIFATLGVNWVFQIWGLIQSVRTKVSCVTHKFHHYHFLIQQHFKDREKSIDEVVLELSILCCFALVLINLQVSMSLDRVYAVCFPMRYMMSKDNNYKTIMIVLSFVQGLIGGSALFVFFYYGHSEDTIEFLLKYNIFYSLWTFVCCLIIIIGNGSIFYSIRIRVRNSKINTSHFSRYHF